MASTLIKATIGLAGATTVGGGATLVYLNSGNNKSIRKEESTPNKGEQNQDDSPIKIEPAQPEAKTAIESLFTGVKIALLNKVGADIETWKTKWTDFKGKYNELKEKEHWQFEKWGENEPEESEGIKVLQQKCTDNSKKNVVDDKSQLFLDVKEFCTKSTEQAENK